MESSNIFDLNNPENYSCIVWHYVASLSNLRIHIYPTNQFLNTSATYYLLFSGVIYFSGPMKWDNANFYKGSFEECFTIFQKVQLDSQKAYSKKVAEHRWPDAKHDRSEELDASIVKEQLGLFKVTTPNFEVLILADNRPSRISYDEYHNQTSPKPD